LHKRKQIATSKLRGRGSLKRRKLPERTQWVD
jgi:hypothetical protein